MKLTVQIGQWERVMEMYFTVGRRHVGQEHYRREYVEALQKQYMDLKQRVYELAKETGSFPVQVIYRDKDESR